MAAAPIIPISYKNTDTDAVPSFACVQFKGDNDVTATNTQSVKIVKPDGNGPYALDLGQGAAATGPAVYSQCCNPLSHTAWAYYLGSTAPGPAWTTEIGPVAGAWDLQNSGRGFLYAGQLDHANNRILVMQKSAGGGLIFGRATSAIAGAASPLSPTAFTFRELLTDDATATPHTQKEADVDTQGVQERPDSYAVDSLVCMTFTKGEWHLIDAREVCST